MEQHNLYSPVLFAHSKTLKLPKKGGIRRSDGIGESNSSIPQIKIPLQPVSCNEIAVVGHYWNPWVSGDMPSPPLLYCIECIISSHDHLFNWWLVYWRQAQVTHLWEEAVKAESGDFPAANTKDDTQPPRSRKIQSDLDSAAK